MAVRGVAQGGVLTVNAASVAERLRQEIDALVREGRELSDNVRQANPAEVVLGFSEHYQKWYTRALAVVRTLALERLDEFRRLYEGDQKRKVLDATSYCIADYVRGHRPAPRGIPEREPFDVKMAAYVRVNTQVDIVASAAWRLDDILSNIRGVLQANLFNSELEAARHLRDNGHLRAAGAVAGVVLESHLAEVCTHHSVAVRKKDPHVSDYNDALKNAGVFDVIQWRGVQRLADIRNLCDHKKQRDPTPDEVDDLISGVDKAIKTLA
jgi:hypothetical protein